MDFYCSSQDETCRRWAGKALGIANLSDDGGTLYKLLQEKYAGLTWDQWADAQRVIEAGAVAQFPAFRTPEVQTQNLDRRKAALITLFRKLVHAYVRKYIGITNSLGWIPLPRFHSKYSLASLHRIDVIPGVCWLEHIRLWTWSEYDQATSRWKYLLLSQLQPETFVLLASNFCRMVLIELRAFFKSHIVLPSLHEATKSFWTFLWCRSLKIIDYPAGQPLCRN